MAPRLLHADDKRNPSYYLPRAGHPAPTKEFYEGRENGEGTAQPVSYTHEKFVRGFDLTCGEFYRLREAMIPHLLEDGLYAKSLNEPNPKWEMWEVYEKALQHGLLKEKKVPPYWKHKIIHRFIQDLAMWMVKKNLAFEGQGENWRAELPRDFNWEFGADIMFDRFEGWYQFQHLVVMIEDVNSLVPWPVKVRDILRQPTASSPPIGPVSWKDINIAYVSFDELWVVIKKSPPLAKYNTQTHVLKYRHPEDTSVSLRISDDASLQGALTTLRAKSNYHVRISIVAQTEEVVSQECSSIDIC